MQQRTALVTGANRGIGLELCRQLAQIGYKVVLTSRDEPKGHEAFNSLNGQAKGMLYHPLDVSSDKSVKVLLTFVQIELGHLDVLINNAAIHYDTDARAIDADLSIVNQALQTNLLGPWRMCEAFIPS